MRQPEKTGIQTMTKKARHALSLGQNRTTILSTGLARVNCLTRAARHLPVLLDAFAEWAAGEIYVCKKTGTYRYRFGERSKGTTPWSHLAVDLFPTVADFAFAAAVFHESEPIRRARTPEAPSTSPAVGGRVNVIQIAA